MPTYIVVYILSIKSSAAAYRLRQLSSATATVCTARENRDEGSGKEEIREIETRGGDWESGCGKLKRGNVFCKDVILLVGERCIVFMWRNMEG